MKRVRYTDEQIAFALRQAEAGSRVSEVCRKIGVSEQTFYRWKKRFAGMGVAELRRLKQLEDENCKLKGLVADLSLDRQMLQDVTMRRGPLFGASAGQRAAGTHWRRRSGSCSRGSVAKRPFPTCAAGKGWTPPTTTFRQARDAARGRRSSWRRARRGSHAIL